MVILLEHLLDCQWENLLDYLMVDELVILWETLMDYLRVIVLGQQSVNDLANQLDSMLVALLVNLMVSLWGYL